MSEEPVPAAMAAEGAPDGGVEVRRFRQGAGDCFLLVFPTHGPRPCHVLVDCGVLLSAANAGEALKQGAASLLAATGGTIDVLVATLGAWDHVASVQQAKEMLEPIEIGHVWAAWTADPKDPAAQRLRVRRETAVRALQEAAQELRQCGEEDGAKSLESVLGSFGDLGKDGRPSATQQTMAYILGRGNPPRYLRPGDQPELPGLDGVRVHVLGPPGGETPRRPLARAGPEEDGEPPGLDPEASLEAAVLAATQEELETLSLPFDPYFRVAVEAARQDPFFQGSYFGVPGQPSEREMAWRQIETEWLTSASQLTSDLDSHANNASLALAFELVPGGKVLLFAAGVEKDDWLAVPALPVPAADLLHRAVLFKVGSHASPGTPEAGGPDSGELTVFPP